ncbi:MAG: hypothetical protein HYX71_01425 [Opitutae bacterium]|nr:hypothetical protein [Opitutae bacterium]
MKIVVILLLVCALSGLAGGITGVKRYSYSSVSGPEVTHYDPIGRAGVLLFGITSLAAAVGCWKRRIFGWYITIALMGAAIGITVWGIIMILAASWSSIPTALWWSAQIVAMSFLIRWWLRQKQFFEPIKKPNQISQPTPSGVADR